jgi:hypothetical protein
MKSMCFLCIKFTHENTSERTILHLVKKFAWLLALQKRLATPLPVQTGKVSSSFPTVGRHRLSNAINPVISHVGVNDGIVTMRMEHIHGCM